MLTVQDYLEEQTISHKSFVRLTYIFDKLPTHLNPKLIHFHHKQLSFQVNFSLLHNALSFVKVIHQPTMIRIQTIIKIEFPEATISQSVMGKEINNFNIQGPSRLSWKQTSNQIICEDNIMCSGQIERFHEKEELMKANGQRIVEHITNQINVMRILMEKNRETNKCRQKKVIGELKQIQKLFEKERINREKSTRISSLGLIGFDANLNITGIFHDNHDKRRLHSNFSKVKTQSHERHNQQVQVQSRFQRALSHFQKAIINSNSQQQRNSITSHSILTPIQIHQLTASTDYCQSAGSFGSVSKVFCTYIQIASTNSQSDDLIQNHWKQKQQLTIQKCQLIRKKPKKWDQQFITPLSIQLFVLRHLRREVCRQVASYLQNCLQEEQQLVIYSKYYPRQFDNFRNYRSKILALADLCLGINFLMSHKIIHRDLKPANLRLKTNNTSEFVKIIDFGSSAPIYGYSWNLSLKYQIPRTTRDYSIQYSEAADQIHAIMNKTQFDQHSLYDMYAFGKIAKQLFSSMKYECAISDILKYLIGKCMESNPEDRLTPNHVMIMLYYIEALI